jgi:hypothetical protein
LPDDCHLAGWRGESVVEEHGRVRSGWVRNRRPCAHDPIRRPAPSATAASEPARGRYVPLDAVAER